jgi:hypothetical protein
VSEAQKMGTNPPSDEWKHVDRGKERWLPGSLLNRKTLIVALKLLSQTVRLVQLAKDLIDDV